MTKRKKNKTKLGKKGKKLEKGVRMHHEEKKSEEV